MSSITMHYDSPPRMAVRCVHCDKISIYPVDIRCPAYNYRDEAAYWEKRCLELEAQLVELMTAAKGSA